MSAIEAESGFHFTKKVPAGEEGEISTGNEGEEIIVKRIAIFVYGNETLLNLKPGAQGSGRDGGFTPFIETVGSNDNWITGHHADYVWHMDFTVEDGRDIVVKYDNRDSENAHRFRINLDVNRGGFF